MKKTELLLNIAACFAQGDVALKESASAYILGEENGKARVIQELKKLGVKIPEDFGKSSPSAVT